MRKVFVRATAASVLVAGTVLAGGGIAQSQGEETASFEYTGEAQAFTVPADVCSIEVDAFGAAGNTGEIIEEDSRPRADAAGWQLQRRPWRPGRPRDGHDRGDAR